MVKVVNFSMDESFYKAFRTQARRDDKSMSEIVRQLIAKHYLAEDAKTRELECA